MPRRFTHQSDVSASSGEKVTELPSRPMRTACATVNVVMSCAFAARRYPAKRETAPTAMGSGRPRRSASLPMRKPPMPYPIISSE